eukprot:Skav203972  [mRNA]  locus=scaffold94:562518:565221:+ [translate_table: standard]
MPPFVERFLQEFDIAGSTGCELFPERTCILICDLAPTDDQQVFTASKMVPEGTSSALTLADIMGHAKDSFFEKITLRWDNPHFQPKQSVKMFLIRVLDPSGVSGYDPDYVVDEMCLPLEVDRASTGPLKLLELFCGAYGGNVVLLRDVCDQSWWPAVSTWGPDVVTVSSPCPSWSGAANALGLEEQGGQLMAHALVIIKFMRPAVALLEQVGNFASHHHKPMINRLIRWAGYKVAWSKVINMSSYAPVNRPRWLACLIRVEDPSVIQKPFSFWNVQEVMTPHKADAVFGPDIDLPGVAIDVQHMQVASRHDLLPPAKRSKISPQDVLASRCFTEHEIPPTFMAAYGSQHQLREELLSTKGLYVHYLKQQTSMRLWHPFEICLLHCSYDQVFLDSNIAIAFQQTGNMISIPHALLLLCNSLNLLPDRLSQPFDVPFVFEHFKQHLLKASQVRLIFDARGSLMIPSDKPVAKDLWTFLDQLQTRFEQPLQEGFMWHPKTGVQSIASVEVDTIPASCPEVDLIEEYAAESIAESSMTDLAASEEAISPTFAFVPLLRGRIKTSMLTIHFWFAASLPFEDIMKIWGHAYEIDLSNENPPGCSLTLVPVEFSPDPFFEVSNIICIIHDHTMTLHPADPEDLAQIYREQQQDMFDQFGAIEQLTPNSQLIAIFRQGLEVITPPLHVIPLLLTALQSSTISCQWDPHLMQVIFLCSGDSVAIRTLQQFWALVLNHDTCFRLDITMMMTIVSEGLKVYIEPSTSLFGDRPRMPIPMPALMILIVVRTFRMFMDHMQVDVGISVTIKWLGRTLWSGTLAADMNTQTIANLTQID